VKAEGEREDGIGRRRKRKIKVLRRRGEEVEEEWNDRREETEEKS
jgi:hypothetical protein